MTIPASVVAAVEEAAERERAGQAHGAVAAVLRKAAEDARRAIIADFARGDAAAERFSKAIDDCIRALFAAGARRHPDAAKKLGVAAVGGYGRGLLAPYSDVDLLFLSTGPETATRPLLDFILYPLWDAGLKIGHATHSPASALAQAKSDLVVRTAFLDARLVAGAAAPLGDFQRRLAGLRLTTRKSFRRAKLDELDARHGRLADSAALAEPDIKEGRGGLRDLHAVAWVHRYEFDRPLDSLRGAKLFSVEEVKAFKRCERFLWSVRVQLHGLRGRADDQVTFDIQPLLAERLGYAQRAGMSAAERMMRDYFVNALEVGRLVRIFRAKLDELDARLSPKAFRILPKALQTDEAGPRANLKLSVGRLTFDDPARARRTPIDLFRLFRAYARRPDLDVHPEALSLVAASAAALSPETRKDPAIASVFLAILTSASDAAGALRLMSETGLLGRYIPSFGKIVGRTEYGLYRRYSIDESVFQSIAVLAEIERGAASARHPIATRILHMTEDRASYHLATFLHEIAWSLREPTPDSVEKLVETIVNRLGVNGERAARIAWCAARPLHLVRTAERRNLSDPAAVVRFAAEVGDAKRLDLLLVLAVCHLRVVGVSSWDEWRRRQITELYEGARDFLSGGKTALIRRQHERAEAARLEAERRLPAGASIDLAEFPDEMFRTFDSGLIARIADLAASSEGEAAVMFQPREGALEAVVYADDRTGLLADLAGAVASAGASVRSVHAMTTSAGKAIDVFFLQTLDGGAIADPETIKRLHARLLAAAQSRPAEKPQPQRRIGDRRSIFHIPARASADVEASTEALVIDAEGRDRPGLLHDLTSALAEMDLAIRSAHVATYGARAVDAFYVVEADGSPVANKRRIQAIERRLEAVLSEGRDAEPPATDKESITR